MYQNTYKNKQFKMPFSFKNIFLGLTTLCFVNYGFAQSLINKQYELSYSVKVFKSVEGQDIKSVNVFNQTVSSEDFLPYFTESIQIPNSKTLKSVTIKDASYELVSEKLSPRVISKLGDNIAIKFLQVEQRKSQRALFSFVPLVNLGGEIKIVKSFTVEIELEDDIKPKKKSSSTTSTSVLSSGEWHKVGVVSDGIYKVTFEYLKSVGANVTNLSSNAIHVFGNGAGMLPEDNSEYRPDDLLQNAIRIVDGGDGQFNEGDYLLFYANGPHKSIYNGGTLFHQINNYSDTSFYFIGINTSNGSKQLAAQSQSALPHNNTVTTFDDFRFFEPEQENLIASGRRWFGSRFGAVNSAEFSFNFPNINKSNNVEIRTRFLGRSFVNATSYKVSETNSGFSSNSSNISTVPNSEYAPFARESYNIFNFLPTSDQINLSITFNKFSDPSAEGWIDFIQVLANRNLRMSSNQMSFLSLQSVAAGSVSKFILSNAQEVSEIWDITDPTNASSISFTNLTSTKEFVVSTEELKRFVAITSNHNFPTPVYSKKVVNQNLHGLGYADLIIVAHKEFMSEASELKTIHEQLGSIVHLVEQEQVFNEFSSGMPDVTAIRLFMKMFYDRATTANEVPKNLLLFGDGSYDNRNKLQPNTNFIITYESEESLIPTNTYTSDDYFVTLSDNEIFRNSDLIDMGVGRFPVKSKSEAQTAVNKVRSYVTNVSANTEQIPQYSSTLKDWRTMVALLADDEDNSAFIEDSENIYDRAQQTAPELNIQKIYMDAYKQEKTPGGQRYPQVEDDLRNRVENGALLLNFVGHGGTSGWTQERVLNTTTISEWTNKDKMPVFMTATCEFSRWDNPRRTSGGELAFLNPNGAAIALFTTTRVVFASQNSRLINFFFDSVFVRQNLEPQTLGSIYMKTKNAYANFSVTDIEFRKFSLLGDPALKLAIPQHKLELTHLNDKLITDSSLDTLKALSKVTIKGVVKTQNNVVMNDFNGIAYVSIYDKKRITQNLQNDPSSTLKQFEVQNNILFKGRVSVKNGLFQSTFIVPKDIDYQFGKGRVSMYGENGEEDGLGYSDSLYVGGIDENAPEDKIGPEIKLYLNDSTFVYGSMTNESPILIAKLFDESGLNTVGNGVGHDLSLILDNNSSSPIILNELYEAELDNYQKGQVRYNFNDLEPGPHTLTLKAYDVYNNPSSATLEFVVVKKEELALDHVLNYPNPFTTSTQFMFEHNQAETYLRVRIEIFTITGKLVKTIKTNAKTNGFRIEPIHWNGRDEFGDKIARGVYVYKVSVENLQGESVEKIEKLVILN
jgi:hypothetical protein